MPRELKIDKVRNMAADEVQARIKSVEEELFNLRFRNAMRQLDNPVEIRNLKRDLARLKTALKEHQSGIRALSGGGDI